MSKRESAPTATDESKLVKALEACKAQRNELARLHYRYEDIRKWVIAGCDEEIVQILAKAESLSPVAPTLPEGVRIEYVQEVPCPKCGGSGECSWTRDFMCNHCGGHGLITRRSTKLKQDASRVTLIDGPDERSES